MIVLSDTVLCTRHRVITITSLLKNVVVLNVLSKFTGQREEAGDGQSTNIFAETMASSANSRKGRIAATLAESHNWGLASGKEPARHSGSHARAAQSQTLLAKTIADAEAAATWHFASQEGGDHESRV